MTRRQDIAAALRHIGQGFDMLARVLDDQTVAPPSARYLAALRAWGDRGLTRVEASALLRKHGFAPQAAGAWVRGDWIEVAQDGLRYLTKRSHAWVSEQGDEH